MQPPLLTLCCPGPGNLITLIVHFFFCTVQAIALLSYVIYIILLLLGISFNVSGPLSSSASQKVGQNEAFHSQTHDSIYKQSCLLQEFRQNHQVGKLGGISSCLSQEMTPNPKQKIRYLFALKRPSPTWEWERSAFFQGHYLPFLGLVDPAAVTAWHHFFFFFPPEATG